MKVLQLKFITEKGREAINKQNKKNKNNWQMLAMIRATGGKLIFTEGGMEFRHFIFKNMIGDLNSADNKQSQDMKKRGFKDIEQALLKDDCVINIDYKIEFVEVLN